MKCIEGNSNRYNNIINGTPEDQHPVIHWLQRRPDVVVLNTVASAYLVSVINSHNYQLLKPQTLAKTISAKKFRVHLFIPLAISNHGHHQSIMLTGISFQSLRAVVYHPLTFHAKHLFFFNVCQSPYNASMPFPSHTRSTSLTIWQVHA